jgi:hypothetical protein
MAYWKKGDSLDAVVTPTAADVAFFAGFYEGEGSSHNVRAYKSLGVKVRQKEPEMLYRMRDFWGGSVKFSAVRSGKPSPTFDGLGSNPERLLNQA